MLIKPVPVGVDEAFMYVPKRQPPVLVHEKWSSAYATIIDFFISLLRPTACIERISAMGDRVLLKTTLDRYPHVPQHNASAAAAAAVSDG